MNWPEIQLITNQIELSDVTAAAAAEGHETVYPTHLVRKGGVIVGWHCLPVYRSIDVCQPVCVTLHWFSKVHLTKRECFEQVNWCENQCRALGYQMVVPMIGKGSGFEETISGMGYQPATGWVPFVKKL